MSFVSDVLAATLRNATPLVYGTVGETYCERAGILNLGIEGTMYAGAFFGFLAAQTSGSLVVGLVTAIAVGLGSGVLMGVLTVTFGTNQHVAGLGTTLFLIGAADFANRLQFRGSQAQATIKPFGIVDVFGVDVLSQYAMTYVAFLVIVPLAWWVLMRTTLGLNIRAVGENPEAADAAGVSVARTRYLALMIGGALMGVGGAFFTLAALGSFTLNIIAGRGWVCIALVIFGRWRIGRGVVGALLFAFVYALQLRLRLIPSLAGVPFELLLALPYVVVIAALVLSGRNVAYPGAYLKPYRRA
ncbi:putative ABC-type transport system permease component [Gaiella occulta]|uniref:Putative ABC-type transport system permease component n=1 Tax=Gaiella occulta TaxID=1002870 RepID=A0A7M2Z195_9ACTN|nr:ABC transporter permease [Gaiella occulta]RDI75805.1 putative ABC-type transport system permease component [Gaiella occulta]